MAYWLLKTEPGEYSFEDLEREGVGRWDGVRNPQALGYLRAMEPGDGVVVYHSGAGRAAVGLAVVERAAYPDPTADDGRWVAVDVRADRRLARPVTLAELRGEEAFADSPLTRQGRLSVVPLTPVQWRRILERGEGEPAR